MRIRPGIALALAAASLFAIGCGETVLDTTKTEEALQANLSKSLGKKVSSVDCPSNVEVKAGATFTCTVRLEGGEGQTATLKIRNEDADVSVIAINGSNGSNE